MNRTLAIALAAAGPLSVALLRLVLPWYTAGDNAAAARAVAHRAAREGLVLWFGLAAMLTLVPGLCALWPFMPRGRLRTTGFGLAMLGYLCVPGLLATDVMLWTGTHQHLPATSVAQLVDGIHPSALVQMGVFVPAHVIGVTLIGVLALRHRLVPPAVAWATIVSQPLHFATAVFLGLPWLDLVAWSLTAAGMAWLAAACVPARSTPWPAAGGPSQPWHKAVPANAR